MGGRHGLDMLMSDDAPTPNEIRAFLKHPLTRQLNRQLLEAFEHYPARGGQKKGNTMPNEFENFFDSAAPPPNGPAAEGASRDHGLVPEPKKERKKRTPRQPPTEVAAPKPRGRPKADKHALEPAPASRHDLLLRALVGLSPVEAKAVNAIMALPEGSRTRIAQAVEALS